MSWGLWVASVVVLAGSALVEASPTQPLDVSFLTRGKKVIPLVCRYKSLAVIDIKLPDLVLSNRGDDPVTPVAMEIIGLSKGQPAATLHIGSKLLASVIAQVNPQFKKKLTPEPGGLDTLRIGFGEMTIDAASLSDDAVVKPRQCAVVPLSKLLCFHYVGVEEIDALDIVVTAEAAGKRMPVTFHVPLIFWASDTRYLFPIRGSVQICDMPMNYQAHRQAQSQEFAFDILQARPDGSGKLVTSARAGSPDLSDYYIYRHEVLAVADGEVVEVADRFPEEETVSPVGWSQEASLKVIERLAKTIGPLDALGGNRVLIQHGPDEFSFYGHLSQHTLRVKVGDKVKAGQVIAQVGSTGNSSEPHLHFQLMDSKDFLTANGLPIAFTDLPANEMNQYYTKANSLAASDYLNVFLPPLGAAGGEPASR